MRKAITVKRNHLIPYLVNEYGMTTTRASVALRDASAWGEAKVYPGSLNQSQKKSRNTSNYLGLNISNADYYGDEFHVMQIQLPA